MSPELVVSPLMGYDNDNVFYFLMVHMKTMCVMHGGVLDLVKSSTLSFGLREGQLTFCEGSEWKYFQLCRAYSTLHNSGRGWHGRVWVWPGRVPIKILEDGAGNGSDVNTRPYSTYSEKGPNAQLRGHWAWRGAPGRHQPVSLSVFLMVTPHL